MAENERELRTLARTGSDSMRGLRRRPRVAETLIQTFLFICGAISILTTVGIVYELGKESLLFFTRRQWEQTNKPLAEDIEADRTAFEVSTSGKP